MTVALSDCNLLCEMLQPLPSFQNAIDTAHSTAQFYTKRKPLSATINTLANALYKVSRDAAGSDYYRSVILHNCPVKRTVLCKVSRWAAVSDDCCCIHRLVKRTALYKVSPEAAGSSCYSFFDRIGKRTVLYTVAVEVVCQSQRTTSMARLVRTAGC